MKKLRNWFIGDYLSKTENVFEQAKINLTFNFTIFFFGQGLLLYFALIFNKLWIHFSIDTITFIATSYMLYVIKVKQNIKLAAAIWFVQFMFVGTATMIVEGGKLDLMSGFWMMVELLFAFFTLGNMARIIAVIHVCLQLIAVILNKVVYHGKLMDLGISPSQQMPEQPVFTLVPFLLCLYIVVKFVQTRSNAETIVNTQKKQLQHKNKEITDSINYAQYIQKAILPSSDFITNKMPETFVAFQPKDIVSGDFYWVQEKKDNIYFAVGDCTGHGVPGAFLSAIALNILNNCIFTFNLSQPSDILEKASQLMEETLAKGGGYVRDGMDLALCVYNTKAHTLQYAGANNPIYIISNNQLKEFKATKRHIGKSEYKTDFINNVIPLQNNDSLFLFSDGFPDQFGGPQQKKYKYKPLKDFLLSIHQQNSEAQKNSILTEFNKWKGPLEQVDDVCILGTTISW